VACSRRSGAGGIVGLVALIEQHGEALEADLQREYRRSLNELASGRMSFRILGLLIKGLPGDGTAMWRAARRNMPKDVKASLPPDDFWTPDRDLLATIIDELAILAWQPTKDGNNGRNAPKPIRRPGVKMPGESKYGSDGISVEEFEAVWSAARDGESVDPHAEPDAPEDPEGDAPSGEG